MTSDHDMTNDVCERCAGTGFQGPLREGEDEMHEGECPVCLGSGESFIDRELRHDEMMRQGRGR